MGCLAIDSRCAGLHVRGRRHLQRNPLVPHVLCEPAQVCRAVEGQADVVHDAYAMPEPVGTAPLDRLPDRRQPECLTGVDGEMGVFPAQVFERIKMPGGWKTCFRSSDVETSNLLIPKATASSAISRDRAA